ncbi:MAG: purine-binding chemotaxis protein CheW [Verrucomicrobia bacterium]|nr:purine-binding chemotaxis protein CheW [Verrucomicrobiota bacterium]MBV9657674.1 purine-binding chemotaxis protein CheW [Verrucomicrobiota bacterium]
MSGSLSDALVIFTLDEHHFAMCLGAVDRVVGAVEIAPLPDAPAGVRGVINVQGKILPVFDPRVRCGMPSRELRISDQFIIARTRRREVALVVDAVGGVVRRGEANVTPAASILPNFGAVEGVMKLDGDLILVHDIDRFLTMDEAERLQIAMEH